MCHNVVLVKRPAAAVSSTRIACILVIPSEPIPTGIGAVPTAEVVPTDWGPTVIQAEITSTTTGGTSSANATAQGRSDGIVVVLVRHRFPPELQ